MTAPNTLPGKPTHDPDGKPLARDDAWFAFWDVKEANNG